MANLVRSTTDLLPIFFNVDNKVGKASPNGAEDVALVSFMLKRIASSPKLGPDVKAAIVKVKVGVADQALTDAIAAVQRHMQAKSPHQVVDGWVSKAPPGATYAGGTTGFLICQLNYELAKTHAEQWPRLDKMPECPPAVATLVKRVLHAS
jgi:hypothetical protein